MTTDDGRDGRAGQHEQHEQQERYGQHEQHEQEGLGGLDVAGLQRRLAEFATARGWEPYHTPKNLAVALSVEASELVEIFQWLTPEQSARVMDEEGSAHRVRDEVADVLAYLLQFCEVLGIDVLAALSDKIDRNEIRFPAK